MSSTDTPYFEPHDWSAGDHDPRPTRVRYAVIFAATLMAVLLYLDRFCIGFAVDFIREDLRLSQQQISYFISAFFGSYALAQVPAGYLSDRYGARIMLVIYILTWSLFTAMIGAVWSFTLLLVARLGCGLGQAGAYPTSASVVSKWVPFSSRGTASAIIALGGRIGGALAPLLTATLILAFVPIDTPITFESDDILNGPRLAARLAPVDEDELLAVSGAPREAVDQVLAPSAGGPHAHVWSLIQEPLRRELRESALEYRAAEAAHLALQKRPDSGSPAGGDKPPTERLRQLASRYDELALFVSGDYAAIVAELNRLIEEGDVYDPEAFRTANLPRTGLELVAERERTGTSEKLSDADRRMLNRFLLESALPYEVSKYYAAGWRPVMLLYGAAGLFVAALVWLFFRHRPEAHPWCNQAECDLIAAGRPPGAPSPHGPAGVVPLKRLVTSRSMWMVCLMQFGTNVGWLFLLVWLPRYLIDVYRMPILERGFWASVPPIVGIVGMFLGGPLTDFLAGRCGLRWGRRLPMMVTRFTAAAGYALVLWFSTFAPDSPLRSAAVVVAALSLVAFSTDAGTAATWAFKQDVGGRYVGSILGWGNMWGNLGAFVSPLIYDYYLGENPQGEDWNAMFLVCMLSFVAAGLCAFGIDATQPIAPPDEPDDSSRVTP